MPKSEIFNHFANINITTGKIAYNEIALNHIGSCKISVPENMK